MEFVKDPNTNTNKLVIPKDQWNRLNKALTKKYDDNATLEEIKRLKDEQKAKSKAIAETWSNPSKNKRGRAMEAKKKLMADVEAAHLKRDEERRLEVLEHRNMIIEKARLNKWSEKDSTKTLSSRVQMIEVYKERALQMEFNNAQKASNLEKMRLLHEEQNLDAERYTNEQREQKLQEAKTKKEKSVILLKQLKEREDHRLDQDIKLKEDGKRELERIAIEIQEENEKNKIKMQAIKESMLKNLADNREIVENKNKVRQMEEKEENEIIAIMADAKKKMATMRILKEKELKNNKKMCEQMSARKPQLETDLAFQKAAEIQEAKYQKEQLRKKELANQMKKELADSRKAYDEKKQEENQRLERSRQWERDRWQRESKVLRDLEMLERQAKVSKMKDYQQNLDIQCENNRIANMAEKQEMLKYRDKLIKLSQEDHDEFMTYTKSLIDKYEKAGLSVKPLLQSIKDFLKLTNKCS